MALAIEIRQLTHRRQSAPRDAAAALDMLIDAKSREAEKAVRDQPDPLKSLSASRVDRSCRADTTARMTQSHFQNLSYGWSFICSCCAIPEAVGEQMTPIL
jgi:hypothetical protein